MASFTDRERFFPQTGSQVPPKEEAKAGLSQLGEAVGRMEVVIRQMNKQDKFLGEVKQTLNDVCEVIASPENAKQILNAMESRKSTSPEVRSDMKGEISNMKEELQQDKQNVAEHEDSQSFKI